LNSGQKKFHARNLSRIKTLESRLPDYHESVTIRGIKDYLNQFNLSHMDIGLRILEKVNYFSNSRTTKQLKLLVSLIDDRVGLSNSNVYFCSMSLSPGKSTDSMLNQIRRLAKMNKKQFDDKFLYLRDLENWVNDTEHRNIIFVDDFIGSGGTVSNLWQVLSNWYNENHVYFLAVILGYQNKIEQIEQNTPFRVIHAEEPLLESERIFHVDNSDFKKVEKKIIKDYCKFVDPRKDFRYGYKNSQSLVIFFYNAPNNSIPILHHTISRWVPLFPRLE